MRTRVKGMTLIEVIVTVAVAGIILAWGLPNLADYVRTSRVVSAANELVAALATARTFAVSHAVSTVVCASSDGTSCAGSATAWNNGWIVFEDCDGGGDLDTSAVACADGSRPETVVRAGQYAGGSVAIQNEVGSGVAAISFSSTGLPSSTGLMFSVCGSIMPKSGHRTIMLNAVGQVTVGHTSTAGACS